MKKRMMRLSALLVTVMMLLSVPVSYGAAVPDAANALSAEQSQPVDDDVIIVEDLPDSSSDELPPDSSELPEEPVDESEPEPEPEPDPAAEEAAEEAGEEEAIEELPEEFPGMPEDFRLSDDRFAAKKAMASDGTLSAFSEMKSGEDFVEDEIMYEASSEEEARLIAEGYGGVLESYGYNIAVAKIDSTNGFSVERLVRFSADTANNLPPVYPNVIGEFYGEPQQEDGGEFSVKPTDPLVTDSTDTQYQWHHENINSYGAWDSTMGDPAVKVLVLDSGVVNTHPDLTNVTTAMPSGITESVDNYGHGSHVAGIIAGKANNELGAGVAPNVSITSVKVSVGTGGPLSARVIRGLEYAIENNFNVVNLSLGGSFPEALYKKAVNKALSNGVVLCIASGNDYSKVNQYPASYSSSNIVVGASTRSNGKVSFSNTSSFVDIGAPGQDIYSVDFSGNGYTKMSGTSMATPVVVGVAALVISTYSNPKLPGDLNMDNKVNLADVKMVESILKKTATKGTTAGLGAGIVNAEQAVGKSAVTPRYTWTVGGVASTAKTVSSGNTVVSISAGPNDTIYYTLDGTAPTIATGTKYTGAFTIDGAGKKTVKAISVNIQGTTSKATSLALTVQKKVTGITMTSPSVSNYGQSISLKAAVSPYDATNKKVKWSVVSPSGVKVSSSGTIKIPAKASLPSGTTEIRVAATAADGYGTRVEFPITLTDSLTGFSIGGISSLGVGKTTTLSGVFVPANLAKNQKGVTWEISASADQQYAKVVNGKVTALGLPSGSTSVDVTVKATPAGNTALATTHTIRIYEGVAKAVKLPAKARLFTDACTDGDTTIDLKNQSGYAITPAKAGTAICETLKWSSSNEAVATVGESTGVVTAVSGGTAKITAQTIDGSNKKAVCTVSVYSPVTGIAIAPPAMGSYLVKGKSLQLAATISPAAAYDKSVTWSVLNDAHKKLITVSKTGKVTAKANNNEAVVVRATSNSNPSIFQDFTINLKSAPVAVALTEAGKTVDLTTQTGILTAYPLSKQLTGNCGDFGVTWSSSNAAIAEVSSTGMVTAKRGGTVTITATANDYSGKKATCKVAVHVPASGIAVRNKVSHPASDSAGKKHISSGYSSEFVAALGASYGQPTSKDVTWSIEPGELSGVTEAEKTEILNEIKKFVSVNNGKVSIKKAMTWYNVPIFLKATLNDGTGRFASYPINIAMKESKPVFVYSTGGFSGTTGVINFRYIGSLHQEFTVTSTNTKVALPIGRPLYVTSYDVTSGGYSYRIHEMQVQLYFHAPGSAKIKVVSNVSGNSATSPTFTIRR